MPVVDPPSGGSVGERGGSTRTMQNSWLAIDVGTAPTVRAQELRFAWERWLHETATTASSPRTPTIIRRADRRLLAALARRRRRPGRPSPRARRGRRGRGGGALAGAPARRARRRSSASASPPPPRRPATCVVVSDANGVLHADRGQPAHPHARGGGHELRRGHAVERAGHGHERHRHRARRRPRRAGLRRGALQRGRAALDLLGRADPRPRQRRADRRDRPHGRRLDRPPRQPRGGHRDRAGGGDARCGSSCRSATRGCARATATRSPWRPRRARSSPPRAARSPPCRAPGAPAAGS